MTGCGLAPHRLVLELTESQVAGQPGPAIQAPGGRYYQFTHDFLVRSLREWLTRKQRETRQHPCRR